MATDQATAQAAGPDRGVTRRSLVILGAGGHARVVADAARSDPTAWDSVELVDADGDAALLTRLRELPGDERPALVLGFGATPAGRRAAVEWFGDTARWASIVHATASVSPSAVIEPGAVVLARAVVNAGATVGRHAIVNSGAIVEHDSVVGAFAHLAPGAVLGGGAAVGDRATIGMGALIRDHRTVGEDAVVGMGAVVVRDVPLGRTVVGNPAGPLRGRRPG